MKDQPMTIATHLAQLFSNHAECNIVFRPRQFAVLAFGLAVLVLEFWLKVPVKPVLDTYLQKLLEHMAPARPKTYPECNDPISATNS
jgi:hypothetical protein